MRRRLPPPPPLAGPAAEVTTWLHHPAVHVPWLADDVRFSVVLSALNLPPGRDDIDSFWNGVVHLSWLGGPAVGPLPQWPQRRDGKKLSHVASLHLTEVADVVEDGYREVWGPGMPDRADASRSLPDTGVLEIFHDCETFGDEPEGRADGAWLVRWVEVPDGSVAESPDGDEGPVETCQVVIPCSSFSIRSPEDSMGLASIDLARVERANQAVQSAWGSLSTSGRRKVPQPLSHVYGHSWKGATGARTVLAVTLPVTGDDEHVLVLDLASWPHLDGWFGDAGHLEVWMRRSDLAKRDFARAWCLIRT